MLPMPGSGHNQIRELQVPFISAVLPAPSPFPSSLVPCSWCPCVEGLGVGHLQKYFNCVSQELSPRPTWLCQGCECSP